MPLDDSKGLASRIGRNVSLAVVANVFSLVIGAACVLVYPHYVGVEDYGYYQLFLFFTYYTIVPSLGLAEGTYLEQGGRDYAAVDKRLLRSRFFWLTCFESVLYVGLAVALAIFLKGDSARKIVYVLVCLTGILIVARYYLINLAQATNQIKDYCINVILERAIAFAGGILSIAIGFGGYLAFIGFDIMGRVVSFVYLCIRMPEVVAGPHDSLVRTVRQSAAVLKSGSQLMIATSISSLVIGVSRYLIQGHWSIVVFAKVSFVISIANMLVRCVNSAGQALFPIMKGESEESMVVVYRGLSFILELCSVLLFAVYPVLAILLGLWLPEYRDALDYAILVLPIALFESKNALLSVTYFKALGRETQLLVVNIASMLISLVLSVVAIFVLESVDAALLALTIVLVGRCIASEIYLSRSIAIPAVKTCCNELLLCALFVVFNYLVGGVVGPVAFALVAVVFVFANRTKLGVFVGRFVKRGGHAEP